MTVTVIAAAAFKHVKEAALRMPSSFPDSTVQWQGNTCHRACLARRKTIAMML